MYYIIIILREDLWLYQWYLREIAAWYGRRWLIIDSNFKTRGTPVDKADVTLALHSGDRGIDVLGHDIAAIQKAAGHVFALAWVALDHLICGLEAFGGNLRNWYALMVGLFSRHYRCIGCQRKVYAGVGYQIRLELGQVDVQGAVESQGRGDRRHHLADKPVQICVQGSLDAELASTNVIDRFIVHHECTIGVTDCRMCC